MPLLDIAREPERIHPDLPIHRLRRGDGWIYYTPGCVVACNQRESLELDDALRDRSAPAWAIRAASEFVSSAAATLDRWRELEDREFAAEALTVHLTGSCNLSCGYCVSHRPSATSFLNPAILRAASRMVAQSCARKGVPFGVAFHGGGEPTLNWARLADAVAITRAEAQRAGVQWLGYLATNATFDGGKAEWLAAHFDRISISCDGPPSVQDSQRPFSNRSPSSTVVEANTRRLIEAGGNVSIRATVARENFGRQAEIVAYLNGRLGVTRIRLEPVYQTNPGTEARDAADFVTAFLEAQRTGEERGCAVTTSCVRLDEVHGPYCDVLRDTVLVAVDGSVGACAFRIGSENLGRVGPDGAFVLDGEGLREARRRAAAIPPGCASCINAYHCARGCPDTCCLDDSQLPSPWGRPTACGGLPARPVGQPPIPGETISPGFRCRVAQFLTIAWLRSIQPEQANGSVLRNDPPLGRLSDGPLAGIGNQAEKEVDR